MFSKISRVPLYRGSFTVLVRFVPPPPPPSPQASWTSLILVTKVTSKNLGTLKATEKTTTGTTKQRTLGEMHLLLKQGCQATKEKKECQKRNLSQTVNNVKQTVKFSVFSALCLLGHFLKAKLPLRGFPTS